MMPTVQIKRGLAAALAAVNPTPLAGEIVWVSDSNTLVVGNGSSAYSSLSVISATPTSHTHGNITNAGAIGSTADQFVVTTTSGVLTAVSAATARTTLSVQPTASPTFTGTAIVSGTFQVKGNSGSLSHAFNYNENGGEIALYTTSEVQASLIDHVGGTGTRVLELVNGNDLYLGLGAGNTTGNVKIQRAGYQTAVTISSTGTATFAGQVLVTAGSGSSGSYKPGLAVSGDDDTGIHQVSGNANTLSVVTGGTERVRVGSGGRVQFFAADEKYGIQINKGATGNGPFIGSDGADIFTISTAGGAERMRVDASGNVGIGCTPAGLLDLGSASGVKIFTYKSGAANAGIGTDLSGSAYECSIFAGGTADTHGRISFGRRRVDTGTYTERMSIDHAGTVVAPQVYADTVGATNRDLFVDSTGKLGYVSSIRESKTDIVTLDDVSWLSALSPVSYRYRKKNADGTYSDEADGVTDYGLIAEDVEAVRPELCFYDDVDGEPQLRGVTYSKLITPMLRYIQQLEARIAALEERLRHG